MVNEKICEDCKKNKAVLQYSDEPLLTLTHGWGGRWICRPCFIKRIEKHIVDCRKQLKEEKAKLRKEKWKEKIKIKKN